MNFESINAPSAMKLEGHPSNASYLSLVIQLVFGQFAIQIL